MNDDTRKLLKVFGVAGTDAEAEVERLAGTAGWRSRSGSSPSRAAYNNNWPRLGHGCKQRNNWVGGRLP
jgi:hypothetical protein